MITDFHRRLMRREAAVRLGLRDGVIVEVVTKPPPLS